MPVLGDGDDQVLYRTMSPFFHILKPVLPLATIASTTFQDTLKESLSQSVMRGHMAKLRPTYIAYLF